MNSERGRFVTGLVVGLLAGLTVALAVALYITKAPVPFVNKVPQRGAEQDAAEAERNKNWDPNAPLAGKSAGRAPAAVPAPVLASPTVPATNAEAAAAPAVTARPTAPPSANPDPAAADAASNRAARDPAAILAGQPMPAGTKPVATAASAPGPVFFVQAGAFARNDDAEQQRARLALMGLTARITEREQSGRTVYRVRLGPFDGRDEAEDQQGKLSAAGIDANLVRVER